MDLVNSNKYGDELFMNLGTMINCRIYDFDVSGFSSDELITGSGRTDLTY